jgi:CheY-like chemotaxis protein
MKRSSNAVALIVEDRAEARERVEVYLTSRGVLFDGAADTRTAIRRLTQSHYDLVFLDLDLGAGGTVEGEGILAWMERHEKHIPTIVISESAPFPSVIRLEIAYRQFVRLRIMHGDLESLGDLVDGILMGSRTDKQAKPGFTFFPTPLVLISLLVILLSAFSIVSTKVSRVMFAPIVGATIVAFTLLIVVWLLALGKISEKGFLKVVANLMRKIHIAPTERHN